jgi:hypothetical protein
VGRRLIQAGFVIAIAIVTFAVQLAISGWRSAIIAGGISLCALIVGVDLFRSLRKMRPASSPFDRALRSERPVPARPADLVAIERAFGWRNYSPDEFEQRIKPVLVKLHRHVVMERHGASPEDAPDRFFPPPLERLRSDRPGDPITTEGLVKIVDAIERL